MISRGVWLLFMKLFKEVGGPRKTKILQNSYFFFFFLIIFFLFSFLGEESTEQLQKAAKVFYATVADRRVKLQNRLRELEGLEAVRLWNEKAEALGVWVPKTVAGRPSFLYFFISFFIFIIIVFFFFFF